MYRSQNLSQELLSFQHIMYGLEAMFEIFQFENVKKCAPLYGVIG